MIEKQQKQQNQYIPDATLLHKWTQSNCGKAHIKLVLPQVRQNASTEGSRAHKWRQTNSPPPWKYAYFLLLLNSDDFHCPFKDFKWSSFHGFVKRLGSLVTLLTSVLDSSCKILESSTKMQSLGMLEQSHV